MLVFATTYPARDAGAQVERKAALVRVAILDDASDSARAALWTTFRRRLDELGYVDGQNLRLHSRFASGDAKRLESLAIELVALRPDVIVAVTTTAALATIKATTAIPIVALGPADPVRSGLVASLARPGGNLTGVSPNQAELAGKWLQLVRELVPAAKSVMYLTDRGNPGEMLVFGEVERSARSLGMNAVAVDGLVPGGIDQALLLAESRKADAIIVATTAALLTRRKELVDAVTRARVPVIYARREYVDTGGLLSYGADSGAIFRLGAEYVDRILRGAKPADLPFEMAAGFSLVLNLKAARAIGVDVPQSVRIRADEVIE